MTELNPQPRFDKVFEEGLKNMNAGKEMPFGKMTEELREKIAEKVSINMLGRNYHELKPAESKGVRDEHRSFSWTSTTSMGFSEATGYGH